MEINLKNNKGFKWYTNGHLYVKGYVFDNSNELFTGEKLIEYFSPVKSSFENKLKNANGIFAVVIREGNEIKFGVDKTRTIPLFYRLDKNNRFSIFDENKMDSKELDEFSKLEFKSIGYVSGNNTLLKKTYQVQAGEWGLFSKNKVELKFYFSYTLKEELKEGFEPHGLDLVFDNLIKRVIKFANGRKLIVPLSGGYDSRLIVTLLRKFNYNNVLCFTYGRASSFEVSTSKKVAEILNYDWVVIEYNKALIQGFSKCEIFKLFFFDSGSNLSSLSHIQDFFAIKELKRRDLISKDSIFLPGHSGDFLAGSHLNKNWKIKNTQRFLIKSIFNNYYTLSDFSKITDKLERKILSHLGKEKGVSYSMFENWVLKERQAKFIVNSVRVYEVFNCKYMLPLWDNEMIMFFKYLPLKRKINTIYFDDFIENQIFESFGVNFKKTQPNSILSKIKARIPQSLKQFLKGVMAEKVDVNNFNLINEELGEPKGKYIITVLVDYYLKKIENDFS